MSVSEPIEDLVDRLHLDQRTRWLAGQRLAAEWYLDRHPALRGNSDALISLVYGEYCLRDDLAEGPDPQEFLARFPAVADELGRLFDVDRELASSGFSGVTGPSFPRRINWPGKTKPLMLIDDRPEAAFPSAAAAGFTSLRTGYVFYSLAAAAEEDESRCSSVEAYVPLNVAGRGSTGVIYTARRRGTDEVVALKFITLGPYENAELAALVADVQAVAKLAHPAFVPVIEVSTWNGLPYLVQQRVDGPSLAAWLAKGPLTPVQATRLAMSIARGLDALHTSGLLHRNLKPANILLTGSAVQISDAAITTHLPKAANFGCLLAELPSADTLAERMRMLARAVRRPADTALVRHDGGYLLGHPSCLAPELLSGGAASFSSAADMYALGAVWYAALTGSLPFQHRHWQTTLEQARQQAVAPPSVSNPKIPPAIDDLVLRLLQKQAGVRPSTAELAALAGDWLATQPDEPLEVFPTTTASATIS